MDNLAIVALLVVASVCVGAIIELTMPDQIRNGILTSEWPFLYCAPLLFVYARQLCTESRCVCTTISIAWEAAATIDITEVPETRGWMETRPRAEPNEETHSVVFARRFTSERV